ncbi:MAG: PIG-L deacetylase family protein [Xanthomonadales bacterium]|nr:PIG-L deacetylase family protein [Xanthomonadales bacterium]
MKVLVLSPHPDDESIGCGGTLRKHVVEGADIKVVFLTSGEQGGHGFTADEARRTRELEAQQATEILGITDIEYWREKDGLLRVSRRLTEKLVKTIQNYRPDLIFVPNESESHSDHRATFRLLQSVRRKFMIEARILKYEIWTPLKVMDEIVDITPYMDSKVAAVQAYKSQCNVLRFDEAMLGLARYRGELFCWPKIEEGGGRYAEVFQVHAL